MSWSLDAWPLLPFWSNTILLMLHMNSFITCLWAVVCHLAIGTLHEHAIKFAVGHVAVLASACRKSPGHQQVQLVNRHDTILRFTRLGHSALLFSHSCVVCNLLRVCCCCLAAYFVSIWYFCGSVVPIPAASVVQHVWRGCGSHWLPSKNWDAHQFAINCDFHMDLYQYCTRYRTLSIYVGPMYHCVGP